MKVEALSPGVAGGIPPHFTDEHPAGSAAARDSHDVVALGFPMPKKPPAAADHSPQFFLVYKVAPGYRTISVSYEQNRFQGQFVSDAG